MLTVKNRRNVLAGAALIAGIIGLGFGQAVVQQRAEAQRPMVKAPVYEVDPLWPKP